ncbi:MAG: hypothetical protein ABDI19_04230 [Armatimonadota bacterium]
MDQASGLRQRLHQRSEARLTASGRYPSRAPATPIIKAHLRLHGSPQVQIPAGSLVWHWRLAPRAAVGWDLQARFHVYGLPSQFRVVELGQWRYLSEEWHLLGSSREVLLVADMVILWFPSGGTPIPSLLPPLRPCLRWLCRNRPDIPIILAGVPAAVGRRLAHWAVAAELVTRECPVMSEANEAEAVETQRRTGYYRLLQMCRDHPARPTMQRANC